MGRFISPSSSERDGIQEFLYSLHPFLLSSIAGTLTVAQIILAFFLNQPGP
jgi:hypothetical protein